MNIISYIKKGMAVVSMLGLTLLSPGMVNGAVEKIEDFTDYSSIPEWAYDAIESLIAQKVIQGNSDDDTFAPNDLFTRGAMAKVIMLATGMESDTSNGPSYTDVDSADWAYEYIETMTANGMVNGYGDGTFGQTNPVNRFELAKMVVNGFELEYNTDGGPHFDDVPEDSWAYKFVETAFNNGLMLGFGRNFDGGTLVTRAEAVKVTYDAQLLVAAPEADQEGTLEVKLSEETALGTNIARNAVAVPAATFDFTASDDSKVEISGLVITRIGLGSYSQIDGVWVEAEGFKIGRDVSFTTDDTAELTFNPPIVIPAGQTLTLDVVISLEEEKVEDLLGVATHHRFGIVSEDDIMSTAANISMQGIVEGNEMEISSYRVSEFAFDTLGIDTTVEVGDQSVEIGKFSLTNNSTTAKKGEIRALTFKNDGTAELADSLERVGLYVAGVQVSAETIIDGDFLTFRLDNGVLGGYIIDDGDSRIFSIRADIVSAEENDSINFEIDSFEDSAITEVGTGFGIRVLSGDSNRTRFDAGKGTTSIGSDGYCTGAKAEGDCARTRAYMIDNGDLTISRDPSSLGVEQYSPGSDAVVLLTARLLVAQPLVADGVTIRVAPGTDVNGDALGAGTLADLNDSFTDFRLFINDKAAGNLTEFSQGNTNGALDANLEFTTSFDIIGSSLMKLVADVKNEAKTGIKLKVSVDASDIISPEYVSTNDQVSQDELLGEATGSFVKVTESSVKITRKDGIFDGETIVAGVDNITFLKFSLDNNDSGDVKISEIKIDASAEESLSGKTREYQNFMIGVFLDGVQKGSVKKLESEGSINFNGLEIIIPSSAQREFSIVANTIESSASRTIGVDSGNVDGSATGFEWETLASLSLEAEDDIYAGDRLRLLPFSGVREGTNNSAVDTAAELTEITLQPGQSATIGETITLTHGTDSVTRAISGGTATGSAPQTDGTGTVEFYFPTPATFVPNKVTYLLGRAHSVQRSGLAVITEPAAISTITLQPGDTALVGEIIKLTQGSTIEEDVVITGVTLPADASAGAIITFDATTADFQQNAPNYSIGERNEESEIVEVLSINSSVSPRVATLGTVSNGLAVPTTGKFVLSETTFTYDLIHTVRFDVTDISGNNIENAKDIDVQNGGTSLSSINRLEGPEFEMVQFGTLSVSNKPLSAFDHIIIAKSEKIEVMKIDLNASYDDIRIETIKLFNDINGDGIINDNEKEVGNRLDFTLYDESGVMLDEEKTLNDGRLVFEIGGSDQEVGSELVVPKDERTYITIKADARELNNQLQTGKLLNLRLDQTGADKGIEAITQATSETIDTPEFGWSENGLEVIADSDFLVARTKLIISHSDQNDAYSLSGGTTEQGIYAFQVEADAAYDATLERITFDISTSGITYDDDNNNNGEVLEPSELKLLKYPSGYASNGVEVVGTWSQVPQTNFYTFQFASTESISRTAPTYYEIRVTNEDLELSGNDNDRFNVTPLGGNDITKGVISTNRNTALSNPATPTEYRIIWSDRSNNGNSGAYLGGYGLILPTSGDGASDE